MEQFLHWLEKLKFFLGAPLFTVGGAQLSLWTLLQFVVLVGLLFWTAGRLRVWLVERLLARSRLDLGARQAIGAITRYVVLSIGLLVILQTVGINLTTLNVLAGAVGIGIGFGLQNVASNFISGLIILLERPIRIGDRIEVGGVEGDVVSIGARSTRVVTNDNITIIIPNSRFVTENAVNWTYNGAQVRFRVPVSVAYDCDLQLIEKLLLEVAHANPDVLKEPPPVVRLLGFGNGALNLELRPWSTTMVHRKAKLVSALNVAIHAAFRRHGIELPVPQQEFYLRNGAFTVEGAPQSDEARLAMRGASQTKEDET